MIDGSADEHGREERATSESGAQGHRIRDRLEDDDGEHGRADHGGETNDSGGQNHPVNGHSASFCSGEFLEQVFDLQHLVVPYWLNGIYFGSLLAGGCCFVWPLFHPIPFGMGLYSPLIVA